MADTNPKHLQVSYKTVHNLVGKACYEILKDKYIPDVLVGIATGGLIPVRIAKSFLKNSFDLPDIPIYIIGLSNYDKDDHLLPEPIITQKLDSELEKKIAGTKILMVDEIDDTGRTLEKAADYLFGLKVKELRVLVVHMKEKEKTGKLPENVKIYFGEKIPPLWIDYSWEFKEPF